MNIKKHILLGGLCLLLIGGTGCTKETTPESNSDQLQVTVTFDAMKAFVEAIGGDQVAVTKMIPDGMEPHDFEPKGRDLAVLSDSDLFVYSGLGMESWVEDALASAHNDGLLVVETSKGADIIENTEAEEIEEHGRIDPHIWLSLSGAKNAVTNIKDALIAKDGAHKSLYEENYTTFVKQLDALETQYKDLFNEVSDKRFVTGHAAFAYLCRDFGLTQNSVEDVFSEGEPSAQKLSELVDYCRENNITTVFSEAMASPEVSNTLAHEINGKVVVIYTMESDEDGLSYLERMESNLSQIYESLK